MDDNTPPFHPQVRKGIERSLNAYQSITCAFQVDVYPHSVVLTVQESERDAMVVHLLADGCGDTTIVGDPSLYLRIGMANVLVGVAHNWAHIGFPTEGVREAARGCYGGLS